MYVGLMDALFSYFFESEKHMPYLESISLRHSNPEMKQEAIRIFQKARRLGRPPNFRTLMFNGEKLPEE